MMPRPVDGFEYRYLAIVRLCPGHHGGPEHERNDITFFNQRSYMLLNTV